MPYRSRRLEALLGAEFNELEYHHFVAVVGNPNSIESDDLDWKIRYDEGKDAVLELAKDAAALANASGGLLVLGVAQDKATSAAIKIVGHPTTDQVEREIHQAIAARVFPMPQYQVRRLLDPDGDGTVGLVLIGIPPSPYSPHAVLAAQRPEYAYPRRTGNKIQWLTEPEVATSYRRRFLESASRESRLDDVESEALEVFYDSECREPVLTVSLVPEVPGNFRVDRTNFERLQNTMRAWMPVGLNSQRTIRHFSVASARLQAADDSINPQLHCDFHSDGSGAWAVVPRVHSFAQGTEDDTGYAQVHYIVTQVMNALLALSQHATEMAGVTGTALLRVSLWASIYDHPQFGIHAHTSALGPARYRYSALRLGHFRHGNMFEEDGVRAARSSSSNSVAILDSIVRPGVDLTRTASFAVGAVLQAFGIVDVPQVRDDGTIRTWAFPHEDEHWWLDWCDTHAIPAIRSGM